MCNCILRARRIVLLYYADFPLFFKCHTNLFFSSNSLIQCLLWDKTSPILSPSKARRSIEPNFQHQFHTPRLNKI
jgi:hypothetical protein